MGILDRWLSRKPPTSAGMAKERLQILVAHDRLERGRPSYLPKLQRELLEVIRKYVEIDQNDITVQFEQEGNRDIMELNVILPSHHKN